MDESRRERRKRQTRQRLIAAAVPLFAKQGYDETTVAQIASAADVATKTFFNHFPSKEDVLFADAERYSAMAVDIISTPLPKETVAGLLVRAYREVIALYLSSSKGDDTDFVTVYAHTLATVPAVQAKALHVMFTQQRAMAEALHRAHPDRLDSVTAAAAVGSLIGAVQAAGLISIGSPGTEPDYLTAVQRSMDVAVHGLAAL